MKRMASLICKYIIISTIIYTDKMHEKAVNVHFISFLPIKSILTKKWNNHEWSEYVYDEP